MVQRAGVEVIYYLALLGNIAAAGYGVYLMFAGRPRWGVILFIVSVFCGSFCLKIIQADRVNRLFNQDREDEN